MPVDQTVHRRRRTPTSLHVSSQHGSQVFQSHSMSPSAPRGGETPHKHRIGVPSVTFRSRRSIACLCPESGNQTKGRDACSSVAYIARYPQASVCSRWSAPSRAVITGHCGSRSSVPGGYLPHAQERNVRPVNSARNSWRIPRDSYIPAWGHGGRQAVGEGGGQRCSTPVSSGERSVTLNPHDRVVTACEDGNEGERE